MRKRIKKGRNQGTKSALCLALSLAMTFTLLSPELLTSQVQAAPESVSEEADYETGEASYASDEVIIVYYDEPLEEDADASGDTAADTADDAAEEESVLDAAGVTDQEVISEDDTDGTTVLARLDGEVSVEEAIEVLEEDPAIDYVQPNYTYSLLTTGEEETGIAEETIDTDASEDLQYYLYSSGFTDAWESVTVDGAVTVAVIDTGCDMDHEDLIDTVDSEHAYDVTTGTLLTASSEDDAIGHGTYVCGIIAASAANGVGIAGASYDASVLPVKVFDSSGSCSTAELLAAYDYLDDLIETGDVTNLKVINISLGYYSDGAVPTDQALETVISAMRSDHGVLTICAGGNGTNGTANTAYCYPADFEECVSVTAVTADGENAAFSDYNDAKDIAAYGVNIYTTAVGGGYTTMSGTSSAAPQVAAAAALLYAADSSLTASEVVEILQDTADEITGNLHDETSDIGILNAAAAVESVVQEDTAAEDEETGGDVSDVSGTEEESDDESSPEEGDHANSWRYSDGELISDPDPSGSEVDTLYDYYSTWNSSYGTSGFGVTSYIDGSTLTATVSGAKRIVIDVSHHQGLIDWEAVAADGVDAAIIRCGYGSDDEDQDDRYWLYNIENAIANGLEVGVYLYSYADTLEKAESEAAHVLRCLEEAGVDAGDLDLPIFYDMEDDLQTTMTEDELGEIAETFLGILENEGYAVGIYASRSWWSSLLTDSVFENEDWYKWVARYPASTSLTSTGIDGTDLWQFTSHGTVDGISGNVDVSFDYLGEGAYTDADSDTGTTEVTELYGDTRYETMAEIAREAFADGCDIAVIASGEDYPDALTASALAGVLDAPVVLISDARASDTADLLEELGVTFAYIIGGTEAVSTAAADVITDRGITAERIGGSDRQDTAVLIAQKVLELSGSDASDTCMVASGADFADALSASPYAYWSDAPIYLTESDGTLNDEVLEAIREGGYSQVVILGGTEAVDEEVSTLIAEYSEAEITRLDGENRYETSVLAAQWSAEQGMSWDGLAVASGTNFPDGLTGAALCGMKGSVMLLAASSEEKCTQLSEVISENADSITQVYILGGTNAVSTKIRKIIRSVLN